MRKLILLAIICASLSLPFCTMIIVRAKPRVNSIYDVQLGMNIGDVLEGLEGKYSIQGSDLDPGMRNYTVTGGPDRRYDYEIMTVNGKVASVWTNDAKTYSGDTLIVGNELFDALYAAGQPRRDKIGEAMGVRDVNVSVQLQKPVYDSSSRTLIFSLPNQDFHLAFLDTPSGSPALQVQRVKSLDEKAINKLSASPSPH